MEYKEVAGAFAPPKDLRQPVVLRHPGQSYRKIRPGTDPGGRALCRRRGIHHQQGLRCTGAGGQSPPGGRLRPGHPGKQRQRQHLRRQRRTAGPGLLHPGEPGAGHPGRGRAARLHRCHRTTHGAGPFSHGIPAAAAKLAATAQGSADAATAIMTTDTHKKSTLCSLPWGQDVHPGRHWQGQRYDRSQHGHHAGLYTTDAAISPAMLQKPCGR